MQNNPLISILIVAHNPGTYLRNTLQSCIEQTYENKEILILDNASSEEISQSISELEEYTIIKQEVIRDCTVFTLCENINGWNSLTLRLYRSEENLGPYNGLNFLLEKAQGKYMAIQDHDDIWHPEKLSKQMLFLDTHPEYIGCGTQTVMYYEADEKYFEYRLGEENYYTVHPSLLFRYDGNFRYDISTTEYMCDAWSLKHILCKGEKKIYNLDESLTLHLIKKTSGNYSYRWHTLSWENIQRVYSLHPLIYATLTIGWEIMRKIVYPVLNKLKLGDWINTIERVPFRMMGNTVKESKKYDWWKSYMVS